MKGLLAIAPLALVAGCASLTGIPSPDQLHAAANARFANGPAIAVIARYGQPVRTFQAAAGVTVYEWYSDATLMTGREAVTTTQGQIGEVAWGTVPYQQTTTTRYKAPEDFHCVMQAGVRPDGTVERVAFGGQMGACKVFMP